MNKTPLCPNPLLPNTWTRLPEFTRALRMRRPGCKGVVQKEVDSRAFPKGLFVTHPEVRT